MERLKYIYQLNEFLEVYKTKRIWKHVCYRQEYSLTLKQLKDYFGHNLVRPVIKEGMIYLHPFLNKHNEIKIDRNIYFVCKI